MGFNTNLSHHLFQYQGEVRPQLKEHYNQHTIKTTPQNMAFYLAAMGSAVMGSAVMGSAVMGSAAMGSAVMGSAAMGSAVMGSAAMGSAVMGSAAGSAGYPSWSPSSSQAAMPPRSQVAGWSVPPGVGH